MDSDIEHELIQCYDMYTIKFVSTFFPAHMTIFAFLEYCIVNKQTILYFSSNDNEQCNLLPILSGIEVMKSEACRTWLHDGHKWL